MTDDFVTGDLADTEGGEDFRELELDDETEAEALEADFPISGEPELIAQIPTTSEDVIAAAEMTEQESPHLTSVVCDCCAELNLTQPVQIIRCERCEQPFCFHFASRIDVKYCVNCLSDVTVTKQTVTKEYIHRDEQEKITSVYRRKAREIKISGLSWLFVQRKVNELSDMELDIAIEYHRNLLILLINEQEAKRNARMHRYAGIKNKQAGIPTPSGVNVSNTTQTTVKKVRTMSKNKASEQLSALLGSMSVKGVDINVINAILKGIK